METDLIETSPGPAADAAATRLRPRQRFGEFGVRASVSPAGADAGRRDPERPEPLDRRTAGIAHDFNNLLSVILSCAGELEEIVDGDDQRQLASEIRLAGERGAALVRALLGGASGEPERHEPLDLNLGIAELYRLLARVGGPGVEVRVSAGAELPRVLLTPGGLEQILVNLVANARDAMPSGGVVTIGTSLITVPPGDSRLATGWHLGLAVSDSGSGMSVEVAASAFTPFFTTKGESGSGLGLATVREIAAAAGGDVRLSTTPGAGTTVVVYLPAVRANGDPLHLARAKRELPPH